MGGWTDGWLDALIACLMGFSLVVVVTTTTMMMLMMLTVYVAYDGQNNPFPQPSKDQR
jgi:hypothetical protein